jgi:hypothetical protein
MAFLCSTWWAHFARGLERCRGGAWRQSPGRSARIGVGKGGVRGAAATTPPCPPGAPLQTGVGSWSASGAHRYPPPPHPGHRWK